MAVISRKRGWGASGWRYLTRQAFVALKFVATGILYLSKVF